jgi:uncharacterized protein YprB with RNaseH-like and TPR domain
MTSWDEFLDRREEAPIQPWRTERICEGVEESKTRLKAMDHAYFASGLPYREHWRAYGEFRGRIGYLDIETTGLSYVSDDITLVGIYDGRETHTFIRGKNLEDFPEHLRRYSLIATFNGSRFDLPFIHRAFPGISIDQLHVDLMYPLRRMGFTGGLKRIERELGIVRSEETRGIDGFEAVRLWRAYERGNRKALGTLVEYNREDVENLERILELVYCTLRGITMRGCRQR